MIENKIYSNDIKSQVATALNEDIGSGDITAKLVATEMSYSTTVITREPAIVCGVDWVNETFNQIDQSVQINWQVSDGDSVEANQLLFSATGSARSILTAERTALNFLQLLSGTATLCADYARQVTGTATKILDTRKTIPGLRTAQKYAVTCGGCHNHRIGLYDAYLIKENHIAACGSIYQAITQAKINHPDKKVEIEVENLQEFAEALEAQADIVMLDDFSLQDMQTAVSIAKGKIKIEASGNMTLETIREVARTGVDYISVGGLTKHVRAIDLSMRFVEQ